MVANLLRRLSRYADRLADRLDPMPSYDDFAKALAKERADNIELAMGIVYGESLPSLKLRQDIADSENIEPSQMPDGLRANVYRIY